MPRQLKKIRQDCLSAGSLGLGFRVADIVRVILAQTLLDMRLLQTPDKALVFIRLGGVEERLGVA